MKFFIPFIFILGFSTWLHAQNKPVQGIVIDKETRQRLAKVYIYNIRTGDGLYNNTKANLVPLPYQVIPWLQLYQAMELIPLFLKAKLLHIFNSDRSASDYAM